MSGAQLARLGADCTLDEILEATSADGAVIVEGWIKPSTLERLNSDFTPWLDSHGGTDSGSDASDDFLGRRTRRLQGLAAKSASFVDVMLEPRLVGFAEAVIGPISPSIILNAGEVIEIGPGESAQPFHRDDDAWNFANTQTPMVVNVIGALVDITAEMGGTLVVPGSHLWQPNRIPGVDEVMASELPAGGALFFRGDTLHAGGANRTTDKYRRALSVSYCCGWLRPVENSYTNLSIEEVRRLPRRAQQLLGYGLYDASEVGGGYLGYHQMGDPMRLLHTDS